MMKLLIAALAVILLADNSPPRAGAQPIPEVVTRCLIRERDTNGTLNNCTEAISAGGLTTQLRALVYNARGQANCWRGEYDLALADQNEAIRLVPNFPDAYRDRASCYLGKNDPKAALANYDEAIRLSPGTPGYYRDRAWLLNWMGLHDRALADYDHVIAMRPRFNTAIDERAKTLFNLGRYGEAGPDFVRTIQLTPGDAYPVLWLHIDRLRAHTPDAEEFAANIKTLGLSGWPAPLFSLFLGKAPLGTIEVESAQSPLGDIEGECEVAVFGGEFHLTRGETGDAIQSFKEAVSVCNHIQNQYLTAWAELKRLDPTLSATGPW